MPAPITPTISKRSKKSLAKFHEKPNLRWRDNAAVQRRRYAVRCNRLLASSIIQK
jgi:hypothetical protein